MFVTLKTAVEAPCLPYPFSPHTVTTKAVGTKMVMCAAVEILSGFNDLRRSALVQLPF